MLLVLLGFRARHIRDGGWLLLLELRALVPVGVFVAASVLEGPSTFEAVRAVLSSGSVIPAAVVVAALEVTLIVAIA